MAIIAVAVIAAGSAQASGTSGLYGKVMRGPITPLCAAEEPCAAPAAGAVLVFSRGGQEWGRTRVHSDGTYRITLAAGTYTVRGASTRPIEPGRAWVRSGHYRHVDFSIDTGIR